MGSSENTNQHELHKRWTERLAKWLRRPVETPEKPTTAASQTMREDLEEPRE